MTRAEKEAVARAIAKSLRGVPIVGLDEDVPEQKAQAFRIREEIAMQLGEDLGPFLGTDAERMSVLYDTTAWEVEVRRG